MAEPPPMSADEIPDYRIRFSIERPVPGYEDPTDYVFEIGGEVFARHEGAPEQLVGRIEARIIQANRAFEDRMSLFEVCDSIDQEIHEAASAVYDYDAQAIDARLSDGCAGANVLYLETAQVVPSHRGRGLGLLATLRTIETFGAGVALALLRPFPMQFGGRVDEHIEALSGGPEPMSYDGFSKEQRHGLAKIRRYWRELGFVQVRKHPEFYALDLQQRLPTYDEITERRAERRRQ
jgi:hypothetical protein